MSDQLTRAEFNSHIAPHFPSPIRHLPLEVLHIIFDAARHDPPSAAPFTLSHVCHSWRSFVLASPSLWTTFAIGQPPNRSREYYNLWFQRSQNRELSVYVRSDRCTLANGDFIYILSRPGRSWKEIELAENILYIEDGLQALTASLILKQIPHLRKLHVPDLKIRSSHSIAARLTSLGNLESLAIHASFFTLSPKVFSTCSRLRQIRLTHDDFTSVPIRLASVYQVIQHVSPQLEELRIQVLNEDHRAVYREVPGKGPVYPLGSTNDILSLPRLRELDLSWGFNNSKGYFFSALLRKLCTPNLLILRSFAVLVLGEEEDFTHSPKLTHLELTGHRFHKNVFPQTSIPSFFRTFDQLSNLHSVQFKFVRWRDGEFATALLISCPQLVRVSLHTCFSVHEADLRRLVEGRKGSEGMTCLQHLGVLNCKTLVLDDEARSWFGAQLETFEYEAEAV